jgi:hypothetical protein
MAEVLSRRTAGDVHEARSAGSTDPTQLADVVVTMGCGDACQYIPGRRYVDRELADPAWKSRQNSARFATKSPSAWTGFSPASTKEPRDECS